MKASPRTRKIDLLLDVLDAPIFRVGEVDAVVAHSTADPIISRIGAVLPKFFFVSDRL